MHCKPSAASNTSRVHPSTMCRSFRVRFYVLIINLQQNVHNWWLTFTAPCRHWQNTRCQASHTLAPRKITPRTRSTHRRREGGVFSGWEVGGITFFCVMFCSHLRNFVFSRSCTSATMTGPESATILHWWLGAQGDQDKVMAKFGGENQCLYLYYQMFHLPSAAPRFRSINDAGLCRYT